MQLFVCSDVHTEFYVDPENEFFFRKMDFSGVDVVVLAGDILLGCRSHKFYQRMASLAPHVLAVAGNHEFYHSNMDSTWKRLRETCQQIPNFHYLEQDTVTIEGQRFVGCTLFYNGGPLCAANECMMNDFRFINKQGGYSKFIYKYAQESKAWLRETVQASDIVITHMLPSQACIDNSYNGDDMNGFYFNDCDDIIEMNRPKLWLHGHSHNHYDTMLGDTRVVRNPYGYPGQGGVGFKKDLRISV